MVRTYGPDALVTLIRSYAEGRTDDEAFTDALGLDMTAFGDAWFKDVNGDPEDQVRAPAGATGAGAVGVDRCGPRRPAFGSAAEPGSRGRRVGRRDGDTGSGTQRAPAADDGATWVGILVAVGAIVLLVAAALVARRRRTAPPPP